MSGPVPLHHLAHQDQAVSDFFFDGGLVKFYQELVAFDLGLLFEQAVIAPAWSDLSPL
jgi:hypothetical protein